MQNELVRGEAVFLPLEASLRELRAATRKALLRGSEPRPFLITDKEVYFSNALERLFEDGHELYRELGGRADGAWRGILRCAALWNARETEGVLVNRTDGVVQCAYLPVFTCRQAFREQWLARRLACMAQRARGVPIHWDPTLLREYGRLDGLLSALSEQLME